MISKELLSEALGKEMLKHDSNFIKCVECAMGYGNLLHINYVNGNGIICLYTINIYELAHKCKEWCRLKSNHFLYSYVVKDGGMCHIYDPFSERVLTLQAETEPEAIFKAGEWILNEIY